MADIGDLNVARLALILLTVSLFCLCMLSSSSALATVDDDKQDTAAGYADFERPTKDSIGRACWEFLHTTAEGYPDDPSDLDRAHMQNLIAAVGYLYPCEMCRVHFQTFMNFAGEPDVSSKDALVRWLCEAHNSVNRRQGKPEFQCKWHGERWKLSGEY